MPSSNPDYPESYFERFDPSDDRLFYLEPRRVVHIDDGAIDALGRVYAELLPRSGTLLDLMSSWRTHLPDELAGAPEVTVVGLGLNAPEMADNPQLAWHLVHDINREPTLPFPDATFVGAMCAVSVQYLVHPVEVFAEVARVLESGAPFIVSFSNRCFPTKAVAVWSSTTDAQHVQLVRDYFQRSSVVGVRAPRQVGAPLPSRLWGEVETRAFTPTWGDPLYAVWALRV